MSFSTRVLALAVLTLVAPACKKAETKAPVKKAASPCKGLVEAACGANTACSWVKATKTKAGKDRKAYCRLKPVANKK